ncbi:hypothetical protein [Streptomyces sp. NPDC057623]|uniref:hypothetical protein n=1 Tax=Streptomyces sp. NPDC057623 TaxID=3346187 RepID=UPI0036BEC10A
MGKKLSLVAASVAATVGIVLAAASPAAAATAIGYYDSALECATALSKYNGDSEYHCEETVGNDVPGRWVLLRGMSQ